jgi:hypothetical protein
MPATAECAHCGVSISDPTTQVVHGEMTYCCANCAHTMEQGGSGSDPGALDPTGQFRCTHCGCIIVDESTMQERGKDAFCCANCAGAMHESGPAPVQTGGALPASDRPKLMR